MLTLCQFERRWLQVKRSPDYSGLNQKETQKLNQAVWRWEALAMSWGPSLWLLWPCPSSASHSLPGADHCCNSVHPTWTQSPPREREGLPDVLSSFSALSRPLHTCNLSVFCCMPIIKPVSGERHMNIKVSLESLGTEDTIYFCYTWLCRRESVSEQPGSFR